MIEKQTQFDPMRLDTIINKMVETVVASREEIFEIGEQSRKESDSLIKELGNIKEKINSIIDSHDQLMVQTKLARTRLAEVSRKFDEYTEEDIKKRYEQANELQVALTTIEIEEKQLRERREDLERRLMALNTTTEKADKLAGQVSVVLNYLNGDLKSIGELVADARQKQAFGLKIIEAQEEERRRLSREIHDGPAQLLAHVLLGSEIVERVHRDKGPEATKKEFTKYRELVRNALYDVRRIIYDLRPMSLDDLGLLPTVDKYLKRLDEQYPTITFSFRSVGESLRLPEKLEVACFRLIQEAAQNACKHSSGNRVRVLIEFHKEKVVLLISDNGKGFDPKQTSETSFGLIGMRERVDILEGNLEIVTKSNEGTTIIAKIPIIEEGEA